MTRRDGADRTDDGPPDERAGTASADPSDPDLADESEAMFSVLGDETRLAILLELAEGAEPEEASQPVSFSELRRAVDVEDAGRFNYHLDKLTDTFVVKDDEGYRPTVAGLEVASAIHAGRFADAGEHDPVEIGYECPTCETALAASYENEVVLLTCENDHQWFSFPVPSGAAASRSTAELFEVAIQRAGVNIELARTGLCPRCWGRIALQFHQADGTFEKIDEDYARAEIQCERCWLAYHVPAPFLVGRAPPVVAFYQEHGLGPEEAIFSKQNTLTCCAAVDYDPAAERISVELEIEDERLVLELDGDGEIQSAERV